MIREKYIIRSETLVLRISEGKDRYYKRVSHLLLGDPNLKYWDVTRERFGYRVFCLFLHHLVCGGGESRSRCCEAWIALSSLRKMSIILKINPNEKAAPTIIAIRRSHNKS